MTSMIVSLAANPGPWSEHDGGGWWPVFPIVWLLVLAGIATLVIWLVRRSRPTPAGAAEAQLAERFARGEIDEQEYQDRLAVLRRKRRR